MLRRRKLWPFLASLIALSLLTDQCVPPQHIPWRALDMDAPVGLATGTKITMIALAPSQVCFNRLASADHLVFEEAEPKNGPEKCGWKLAASLHSVGDITFRPSNITTQCSVALASYIWLNDVDKLAQKYLGSGLKSVHHAGAYSCRRQRGNGSGTWSEHAFANAWDITGFELENGQVISVLKDWGKKTPRRKFLRATKKSACRLFRVVLSPDFNTAHKDHFHLDQGPSLSCH